MAAKKSLPKRLPTRYNLLVVELKGLELRTPSKPHLYVKQTSQNPEDVFQCLLEGQGPKWLIGKVKALRNDLVPIYRTTTKKEVAKLRLLKLKTSLSRQGFAVNQDSDKWVVYVLDVNPDVEQKFLDRGSLGKVVYVGQTSTTRERRTAQHAGKILSKSGKFIGSPRVKGRNPRLNLRLSPKKVLFTKEDAKKAETATNRFLRAKGFRVLGDR